MKSIYTSEKLNETSQCYTYKNDIYDLTIIHNSNNKLGSNLNAKGNDKDTVIKQLIADLSFTSLKCEALMNIFDELIQKGIIPKEVQKAYAVLSEYDSTPIYTSDEHKQK